MAANVQRLGVHNVKLMRPELTNPLRSYVECDSTSLFVATPPVSIMVRNRFVFCGILYEASLCLNSRLKEIR